MAWLQRWQLRRAAKQYARRLGPHLQRAYGPSEHYSVGQIRTGVGKLRLNPKFIALGCAAFLPESEYGAAVANAPLTLTYADARELFQRFRPNRLSGSAGFYESGIAITAGGDYPPSP